ILVARYYYARKKYLQGYISLAASIMLILLIGMSRLYLGVHYLSDVIGGFSLGAILLLVYITVYDVFYPVNYRIESHR
ncbi:MAG: phosphatase PAP2 family protein, partial [Clostridiales Family XIII bacterium]|nr:phosphatase PAP2 family protein [Clostridiales Family XIII bacterium]